MAEISGGSLHFVADFDNSQILEQLNETKDRITGVSDAVVGMGDTIDATMEQAVARVASLKEAYNASVESMQANQEAVAQLEARLKDLRAKNAEAAPGLEQQNIQKEIIAIKNEIREKEGLIEVSKRAQTTIKQQIADNEKLIQKSQTNAQATKSLRTQIMELKNEMGNLRAAAIANGETLDETTGRYAELKKQLGILTDIQGDMATQAKILSHDNAALQGVMSAVSGVSGAFTAATGALSLFGIENEKTQEVMVRLQSVMSISMGIQQMMNTLNKDSAASLTLVAGVKGWWAKVVAEATGAEIAETAATTANTAAETANAAATAADTAARTGNVAATTAGTAATGAMTAATGAASVATKGLAASFKLLGVAIKNIPLIGWILAAVSAIAGVVGALIARSKKVAPDMQKQLDATREMQSLQNKAVESVAKEEMQMQSLVETIQDAKSSEEELRAAVEEYGSMIGKDTEWVIEHKAEVDKIADAWINVKYQKALAESYTDSQVELKKTQTALDDIKDAYKDIHGSKEQIKAAIEEAGLETYFEQAGVSVKQFARRLANGKDVSADFQKVQDVMTAKMQTLKQHTDEATASMREYNNELKQQGVDSPTGGNSNDKKPTGGGGKKDPFKEKLDKMKAEYQRFLKWVNSGDEKLVQAAQKEFDGLLKQGATYIDYLKKQRDIILSVDVSKRTKAQNNQLRTLNDAIAEETKKTVLESFNEELNQALGNAKSVIEMLNVIEQRRKALKNDGTELDNQEKESLDEAERKTLQKQQEQTDALLEEYKSYIDQKAQIEAKYLQDMDLLRRHLNEASTEDERAQIQRAMQERTRKFKSDSAGSGDTEYDQLLTDYATYEQKRDKLAQDFADRRRVATLHGDTELFNRLVDEEEKAMQKLAFDAFKESPDWEAMFGDLDNVSTEKLQELIAKIESTTGYLGIEFDPKDLAELKEKLKAMQDEVRERNPFKGFGAALKQYVADAKAAAQAAQEAAESGTDASAKAAKTASEQASKSLKDLSKSAKGVIDLVNGTFGAAVSGLKSLGVNMDAETESMLNDIGGVMEGAGQLAEGIATGNPLAIIQGSISLLTSAVSLFDVKSRKAAREQREHAKNVETLQKAYSNLERAIGKAFGDDKLRLQKEMIQNLQQQNAELEQARQNEEDKKNSDADAMDDYTAQIEANAQQIADTIDSMTDYVLATDVSSIASTLGDALVQAFANGTSAAKAWGDAVDDIVRGIVKNILIQSVIAKQVDKIMGDMTKDWFDDQGNFIGWDSVLADMPKLREDLNALCEGATDALAKIDSELGGLFTGASSMESIAGVAKNLSEETGSLIAGQMNAMRVNQVDALNVMRQQLMHLATISANSAYLSHLSKLDTIERRLNELTDFRSQGF